ncbi:MAG TPA: hypothetical protein DCG57_12810 [Candidatus Riflebacteria bacterium]|jgi:hypothetical protein|nr:hypothetical protein [Candidatus Riflebacteria bacterium]
MIYPESNVRRGSAYLFVIGIISILVIFVLFFSRNATSRRFSTRMMTDEKKAEAVAEAAVDLVMGFVKEKMNDATDLNFYTYFRFPCDLTQASLGTADGKNIPLNLGSYNAPIEMHGNEPALSPIKSLIDELGGEDYVKVKVFCSVVYAEAFAARKDGYQVVGQSKKSAGAVGDSAKFLDSVSNLGASGDGSLSSYNSDWKLDFKLPNQTYTEKRNIKINGVPWGFKTKKKEVTITRLPPYESELKVLGTIWVKVVDELAGVTWFELKPSDPQGSMVVDVMDIIKDYLALPAACTLLTMEAVRDIAMQGDHNSSGLYWQATGLTNEISNDYDNLAPAIKNLVKSDSYGSNPQVVEKTGVFQLRAEVEYLPNGPDGKKIEKNLVANRPFKVSDIHPPAPEYTFFVANSNLLFEGGGDNPMGANLGNAINWSPSYSVASICFHNLPGGEYDNITGFSGGSGPRVQVPGMVRINSRQEMWVNTFIGTLEEPDLTEFNSLVNKKSVANYNVLPTFRWKDGGAAQRHHEVEFPVLSETNWGDDLWLPTGFENLVGVLELCTALQGPVLFFGKSFIEYPLGMRLEAKMKQKYANLVLSTKLIGDKNSPHDRSEVNLRYQNREKKYGIDGMPGYSGSGDWSPDDYKNMPANVYSLMQYAKKATHFYRSEAEFWADAKRFTGGVYDCTGVTYIIGGLTVNSVLKVKGNGILVVKENINLKKNVERVGDSTFTLMARAGAIVISSGCNKIEASCFSNYSPMIDTTNKVEIHGNLVCNEFDRADVDYLEVFFDSANCRITPLSVMRDVGKFEPKRYIVSIADNWTSYKFQKKE